MAAKKNLLVVDDEVMILDTIGDYFEYMGFIVHKARSGNQALQLLKEIGSIELIISDIKMDDGDGIYLLDSLLKSEFKDIPLIFITGFTAVRDEEALEKGAKAVFHKPTNLDTLSEKVEELLK